MDASTANSRFRLPRTAEEESALVSEARPSSTKYKDKWAVEMFHEWERTKTLKFPDLEVGTRGGDSHIKVTGVLVRFFESDP